MAFQFMCPRGHLLEGEESQAGHQCCCPQCGMMFVIPTPVPAPDAELRDESEVVLEPEPVPLDAFAAAAPREPRTLHIPCPKGHVLETPEAMLNQDVRCPHCNLRFHLLERNSLESRRKRQAEYERVHRRAAQNWMTWALAIGVIVFVGVVALIVASMMD